MKARGSKRILSKVNRRVKKYEKFVSLMGGSEPLAFWVFIFSHILIFYFLVFLIFLLIEFPVLSLLTLVMIISFLKKTKEINKDSMSTQIPVVKNPFAGFDRFLEQFIRPSVYEDIKATIGGLTEDYFKTTEKNPNKEWIWKYHQWKGYIIILRSIWAGTLSSVVSWLIGIWKNANK